MDNYYTTVPGKATLESMIRTNKRNSLIDKVTAVAVGAVSIASGLGAINDYINEGNQTVLYAFLSGAFAVSSYFLHLQSKSLLIEAEIIENYLKQDSAEATA